VNIGDIAHTPGLLRLLAIHVPEADVTLWPTELGLGVDALLRSNFPGLKIVGEDLSLETAFDQCDFLLHGSGASLVAWTHVRQWRTETNKPYGIYGITLAAQESSRTEPTSERLLNAKIDLISNAKFAFFRDSVSLEFVRSRGGNCPIMEFGPDAAFACDLRNDAKAEAFMAANGLVAGEFLCCIPRLRFSPYWLIPSKNRDFEPIKHARNEEMKEHDHAPLRAAIEGIVAQTDHKVLICPEDMTQMQVGKEMLYDKLSPAVRKRVVWREDYWLTDEAVSTFVRSAGLFGNELHSAIMCIGHGIPAVICRWAEQTSKGLMWRDIGLDNWVFDLDDEEQVRNVAPAVIEIVRQPKQARETARRAQEIVLARQKATMAVLRNQL
jgi:polysaccharide pyruvyl transferase WcaK-like protein